MFENVKCIKYRPISAKVTYITLISKSEKTKVLDLRYSDNAYIHYKLWDLVNNPCFLVGSDEEIKSEQEKIKQTAQRYADEITSINKRIKKIEIIEYEEIKIDLGKLNADFALKNFTIEQLAKIGFHIVNSIDE